MAFFIVIGCSWLVIAVMLLVAHRRNEDPMAGQWRSQPSTFFGGPEAEPPAASAAPAATTTAAPTAAQTATLGGPAPIAAKPALTGA